MMKELLTHTALRMIGMRKVRPVEVLSIVAEAGFLLDCPTVLVQEVTASLLETRCGFEPVKTPAR